jgi:hypothetical protein
MGYTVSVDFYTVFFYLLIPHPPSNSTRSCIRQHCKSHNVTHGLGRLAKCCRYQAHSAIDEEMKKYLDYAFLSIPDARGALRYTESRFVHAGKRCGPDWTEGAD